MDEMNKRTYALFCTFLSPLTWPGSPQASARMRFFACSDEQMFDSTSMSSTEMKMLGCRILVGMSCQQDTRREWFDVDLMLENRILGCYRASPQPASKVPPGIRERRGSPSTGSFMEFTVCWVMCGNIAGKLIARRGGKTLRMSLDGCGGMDEDRGKDWRQKVFVGESRDEWGFRDEKEEQENLMAEERGSIYERAGGRAGIAERT